MIAFLCWTSIIALIAVALTVNSLYHFYLRDSSTWINKTYRRLTTIIMLCFTSTIILDIAKIAIEYYAENEMMIDVILPCTAALSDIMYFVGNIVFYSLLLLRISKPFQLDRFVFYSLCSLIFIFGAASCGYTVSWVLGWKFDGNLKNFLIWCLLTVCVDDFVLNLSILAIFVRKMQQTTTKFDRSQNELVELNMNLLENVVTKHFVLFGIAIFSNQLFYVNQYVLWSLFNGRVSVMYDVRTFTLRTVE